MSKSLKGKDNISSTTEGQKGGHSAVRALITNQRSAGHHRAFFPCPSLFRRRKVALTLIGSLSRTSPKDL